MKFLFFYSQRRLSSRSVIKRGLLICTFLAIATTIYIIYVPYDFTIRTLSSIYDRCRSTVNVGSASNTIIDCDQNQFLVNSNFSIFTSNPPWVGIVDRRMIAYSAYHLNNTNIIRVLVLKHMNECRSVACYFDSDGTGDGDSAKSSHGLLPGIYKLIRLDCWWDCDYLESFYIDCSISPGSNIPTSVSLIPVEFSQCSPRSWPHITVSNSKFHHLYHHNLTMCVSPIFNWIDPNNVALFIEYYYRQGATRFVFYHRSWSDDVQRVIDCYKKDSRIDLEIISWPVLPANVDTIGNDINILNKHISYNGQGLAMNDCNNRERGRSRFVVHVDLDEFIFPFKKQTLIPLLDDLNESDVGSFIFEHTRVYTDIAPDHVTGSNKLDPFLNITNAMLFRSPNGDIDHFPSKTKVVVKPETIFKQGVHFVWAHEKGYEKKIVPNQLAVLYHLSPIPKKLDEIISGQTEQDKLEMKWFSALLTENLEESVNSVIRKSLMG